MSILACAYDRMHIRNLRYFHQAKLDIEMNPPFHLNKIGDVYFLLHINFSVQIIPFKLKNEGKTVWKE